MRVAISPGNPFLLQIITLPHKSLLMKIGIIGTGHIGTAFAGHAANAGYEVIISNRRGPDSLKEVVEQLGGNTRAGTVEEAAKADVVFVFVPFDNLKDALAGLPDWEGRIVIDPTNAIVFPDFKPKDLGGRLSTEVFTDLVPGARVVKAFNTLDAALLAQSPDVAGGKRVIFISGNDHEANKTVKELVKTIGFLPINLGTLDTGGRLQHFGGPLPSHNFVDLPKQ